MTEEGQKKEGEKLLMDPRTGRPFQVLVTGPDNVGTQSAVLWLEHNVFIMEIFAPIMFDEHPCTIEGVAVEVVDGPDVLLNPDNAHLVSDYEVYVRGAVGLLTIFDLAEPGRVPAAFTAVEKTQEMRARAGLPPLPCVAIGTRMDRPGHEEDFSTGRECARAAADAHGVPFAEVNARTGENVRAAFTDAILSFVAPFTKINDNESEDADADSSHRRRGCTHQ